MTLPAAGRLDVEGVASPPDEVVEENEEEGEGVGASPPGCRGAPSPLPLPFIPGDRPARARWRARRRWSKSDPTTS
jgi:hypothetical protein